MEDLRQTGLAYYAAAPDEIRQVFEAFYREMDPNDNGYVKFKEFAKYMETIGQKRMSSDEFFDDLKQPKNDVLYLDDIITLFYIIHSGRPFCGGSCNKFVKGMYFVCVKCFEATNEYDNGKGKDKGSTFSVCSQCFSDEKGYEHEHKDFLDPIVLLNYKRWEAINNHVSKSSTVDLQSDTTSTDSAGKRGAENINETSQNEIKKTKRSTSSMKNVVMDDPCSNHKSANNATNSSLSTSIVPAVKRQSKQAKMQTLIQFGQLVASLGSIAVASQLCTIM